MDIDPISLDDGRRTLFRFDPTVNTGQIWQFAGFLLACGLAYGTYSADKREAALEVLQIKKDAVDQRQTVKDSLTDIRADVKDIQRTLIDVNQNIAVLKARSEHPERKP